jgi:hypothetical protein
MPLRRGRKATTELRFLSNRGRVGIVGYILARLDGRRPENMDGTHVIPITEKSAVQQPSNTVIWAQVWVKLMDNFSLSNMMKTVGIVSLGVGGLIFFIYFWSIGFMPEIDVKVLVYLLAVSALTGVIVFVGLSISLTYPGYVWVCMTRDLKPLNSPWWFSLPIAGVILGTILSVVFITGETIQKTIEEKGALSSFAWLWVALLLVIVAPALRLLPPIRRVLEKRDRNQQLHENLVDTDLISVGPKLLPEHLKQLGKEGFWQKWNMRWQLKVLPIWKMLGRFYLTFGLNILYIFPVFYLMMMIVLADPYFGKNLHRAGLMLFLIMADVLSININAIKLSSAYQSYIKAIFQCLVIGMIGFSAILVIMQALTLIPNHVMNIYKFGNIPHASLVLDEMGCTIANNHRLLVRPYPPDFITQTTPNPKTCLLSSVTIRSRLGNTYYLDRLGICIFPVPELPMTQG